MDLPPEELQFLTISDILKESISIPKQSPNTFYLITICLIFPLSFAILAHSIFTHPILTHLQDNPNGPQTSREWTELLTFQFCYLIFLFAFSLLSTAAVVFTVASIYTSKNVSFQSTMSAIPSVLKSGVWHLASVVSVLEPIYGFEAMNKSYELLNGRSQMAFMLVLGYLMICGMINGIFGSIVVNGGEDYGIFSRIVVMGFLVGVLVIVNLVMLLVQSIFYYVCKSYHHQEIDKSALCNHLGGYLGEYVPLRSSIQLENMDV
ncbi:hypothetical protein LIER_31646 [Lithospermum erythrorhizon]|uniref:Uncharacterized protein n=1 Tax=Lithospermum erythrorhizon TaxID=34254 RepID=A0AAV3RTG9_LITER